MAFDEQIFAIQRFGGISRVFAELAKQFISQSELGVELQPVAAPLVNEYILRDPILAEALAVRRARHWGPTIARSLVRRRHRGPADIVHNTFYFPRALADYPQAKRVVTIHDMIPELFPATRRRLDFLTAKHRYIERADLIVCVSESTKRDLLQTYGEITTPITVVPSGVSPDFFPGLPRISGWPSNYFLHVGHRTGYKAGSTLFRAFTQVVKEDTDVQLVLVGGGPLSQSESALLAKLGITTRVTQQQVPDSLMPNAYANARGFVLPSEYEGFGLPVLEAMAAGTPAVLSDSSSLPEVGGDAASYFRQGDVEHLAEALWRILVRDGERIELVARGLERAKRFTWGETARKMKAAYVKTLEVSP